MAQRGSVERDGDTWRVRFVRELAFGPDEVWEALTAPERMERWLAPTSLEGRVGGAVEVRFDDAPVVGEVLAWDPPKTFATTWVFTDGTRTAVRVELEPAGAGTRLTLVHHDLPEPMSSGYAAGWHAYLDRFAAALADEVLPSWDDRFGEVYGDYAAG